MVEKEVTINNEHGLHIRAAMEFVNIAKQYPCDITVEKGNIKVDGKSIIGLIKLGAHKGSKVKIKTEGEKEQEALKELSEFLEKE